MLPLCLVNKVEYIYYISITLQASWDKGFFCAIQVYNWVTHKSAPETEGNHMPSYWVEDRASNEADSIPYQIMTYQPQRQYFQWHAVCTNNHIYRLV